MDVIFTGLIGGIVATTVMTISEIPSWKKWGLIGVFEWHENHLLSTKFFHIPQKKVNFKYIFYLHFLNGSLAGLAFPFVRPIINISNISESILILSILYGFLLWIVTLVPIHKPITGCSWWNHQLGHLPACDCKSYRSFNIRICIRYFRDELFLI
jgi:hypothetical protein